MKNFKLRRDKNFHLYRTVKLVTIGDANIKCEWQWKEIHSPKKMQSPRANILEDKELCGKMLPHPSVRSSASQFTLCISMKVVNLLGKGVNANGGG